MYYITSEAPCQVLINFGKVKRLNKELNKVLVEYFEQKNQKAKAKRVKECADVISWKVFNNAPDYTHKLDTINLCRERLCPNCATAKARKKAVELFSAFDEFFQKNDVIFVTLTTENVKGEKLRETVENLTKALKKFLRRMKCKDYFRSTEITYNETTDMFHPHIHLIMAGVDKANIKKRVREAWTEELHKFVRTKKAYVITDVNPCPDQNMVLELCKYITKPTDVTAKTVKWLDTLRDLQLKRGSKSITNKAKKAENEYKLNETREINELKKNFDFSVISYIWDGQNYNRG